MTDPITAARTMIEPLTGYTPKPWKQGQNNPDRVSKGGEYIANCNPTHQSHPRTENNARLMAAEPDLRDMVATLADALEAERAKVAAAFEMAAEVYWDGFPAWDTFSAAREAIRALTPADAQAALDKMLAEARLEGWRAGRDAAAEHCWAKRDLLADAEQKQVASGLSGRDYYGRRLEAELLSRSIRALPEPKEASHG